jgi:hypothetical protein
MASGFFSRGRAEEKPDDHFNEAVKKLMEENSQALEEHESHIIEDTDSDTAGATFLVHVETPRGHTGGQHQVQFDLKDAVASGLTKHNEDSMPSNLVVIERIEVLSANNATPCAYELKCNDRKMRGSCTSAVDKHAAARGISEEGSTKERRSTIITVPPQSTLGDVGTVYTARAFSHDKKFRKYRNALNAGAFKYVTRMEGTSNLLYVPPCATEAKFEQTASSLETGDVASNGLPELPAEASVTDKTDIVNSGDWFLEVMKNNAEAFNHPVTTIELDNPRDPVAGQRVVGLQMNVDDFDGLKDMTESQIRSKLSENVYNLDENSNCTLCLSPLLKNEKDGTPVENVYAAYGEEAPKSAHAVSMLLRMHVQFF